MNAGDKYIRERVAFFTNQLQELKQQQEAALLNLRHCRERCGHSDVETWTNNDGDGQFTVHRCNICGLQKDGPLK